VFTLTIPDTERYNEEDSTFVTVKGCVIQLEHSLISVSKWESKWRVPFLMKEDKTLAQSIDYVRCMTITQGVPLSVYSQIDADTLSKINEYIQAPMTATWFTDRPGGGRRGREAVTSELIYYWMIASDIPFECQKWHLNRLLTLIRICEIKNSPPKKRSKQDILNQQDAINKQRRQALNTSG
jgi:hypothetical protein